ncbi:hypothetical protein EJB05_42580, partial [Eragrostis curvula]
MPNATVRINASFSYFPGTDEHSRGKKQVTRRTWRGALVEGGPYNLAEEKNKLMAIGCNVQVLLEGDPNRTLSACSALCGRDDADGSWTLGSSAGCSGVECCQAEIMTQRSSYTFKVVEMNGVTGPNSAAYVNECELPDTYPCQGVCSNTDGGYQCKCLPGYEGNASVPNGCKDIDECAPPSLYSCHGICINVPGSFQCRCQDGTYGNPFTKGGCSSLSALKLGLGVSAGIIFMLFTLGAPFITRKVKMHKLKRRKERFFKQNHGLLLQQLISQKSDIGGRMIITLRELEKATNNFDISHEIGGGGHGIVYKGLLDLQVVAIKKSKIVVQREVDDFVNEVAVLSQINHRNVVKLLGCCLETEVPLLVYEFIPNGTLAHHLLVEGTISLSWDDRLRIALEISKALAYLHSAASTPILHRDIKSSNILLDDNLTAKVSDFGASKHVPIDQTGVTTAVQGTIGYLDPMYYYTGRLTDKSDVFSFGVLLIELLTRKKPFMYRSDNGDGLVSHFASLLAGSRLVDIIDPQIMKEEGEQVVEVSKLTAKCTKLNGEDRPTMREIEMTLENLKVTKKHDHHDTTSRRNYNRDQIAAHYLSFDGVTMETSRQHSIEEEMLLSARYPR